MKAILHFYSVNGAGVDSELEFSIFSSFWSGVELLSKSRSRIRSLVNVRFRDFKQRFL